MRHKLFFLLFLIAFYANNTVAQSNTKTVSTPLPQVVIPGSQVLSLTSSIVKGQEYTLQINLPGNYNDSTKSFPVLYLLDSQWDFPLVHAINGEQYYDGFIPGIITVGITWGGKDASPDKLRARDFTPTSISGIQNSGKAAAFLSFIKNELIPFIESKYRTKKDDRALMGSSFGGLFTLYALFHETDLFKRYVLTSPSILYDNSVTYNYEKAFAAKQQDLPVRLFMAHGEAEGNVDVFQKWVDHLKSRNYKGLEMQTRILENTGHSGTKAEGYTRGLQWVFARPSVQLTGTFLQQYVGRYLLGNDTLQMTIEKGMLAGIAPDNQRAVFFAASEEEFYSTIAKINLQFKKEKGKVTGFLLDMDGKEFFVKKID